MKAKLQFEAIREYKALREIVTAFLDGYFELLVLNGRPGTGKSHEFESAGIPIIRGWATPFEVFKRAQRLKDQSFALDDAEVLFQAQAGRILLRALTEHRSPKRVQWTSGTTLLAKEGLAKEFLTTSKIVVIANSFNFGKKHEMAAIADRGHLVEFSPTQLEVHTNAANWFWDQEVFDFIGKNLNLIQEPTCRLYTNMWQRKQAGHHWQSIIESYYCDDASAQVMIRLESDESLTAAERIEQFKAETGKCKATYYNLRNKHADQLGAQLIDVPNLLVLGQDPSLREERQEDEAELELLQVPLADNENTELENLKRAYEDALASQNYEEADRLRAEIKKLEQEDDASEPPWAA